MGINQLTKGSSGFATRYAFRKRAEPNRYVSKMNKNRKTIKLFSGGGRWELNACVGENGIQDDHEYARGFSEVPEVLLRHIINNHDLGVDTLVYPLVFTARHSVELYLKESIRTINDIRVKNPQIQGFIENTHSIDKLFEKLSELAASTDRRFRHYLERIHPAIIELSEIDPNGQTFRYAYDLEKKLNLIDISIINLGTFYLGFSELKKCLEILIRKIFQIFEEYQTNTFTSHLSRRDIKLIAKCLPPYETWSKEDKIKRSVAKIQKKFDLSGRKCSEALTIIKGHREFSEFIGLEKPLENLSSAHLRSIMLRYKKLHSEKKDKRQGFRFIDMSDPDFIQEASDWIKKKATLIDEIVQKVPPESIIETYAIYEFGASGSYSEKFHKFERLAKEEAKTDIKTPLFEMLGNKNTIEKIHSGLIKLGAKSIIRSICLGHKT